MCKCNNADTRKWVKFVLSVLFIYCKYSPCGILAKFVSRASHVIVYCLMKFVLSLLQTNIYFRFTWSFCLCRYLFMLDSIGMGIVAMLVTRPGHGTVMFWTNHKLLVKVIDDQLIEGLGARIGYQLKLLAIGWSIIWKERKMMKTSVFISYFCLQWIVMKLFGVEASNKALQKYVCLGKIVVSWWRLCWAT